MSEQIKEFNAIVEFKIVVKELFSVIVKSWSCNGKWNWNVYANIYETHPLFNDVEKAMCLPFHCGCTYDEIRTFTPSRGIKYDWQKEQKTLIVGSDYAHLYDDYDNHPSPFDYIPHNVLRDAKELVDALDSAID